MVRLVQIILDCHNGSHLPIWQLSIWHLPFPAAIIGCHIWLPFLAAILAYAIMAAAIMAGNRSKLPAGPSANYLIH
jgi:hypothetical protein